MQTFLIGVGAAAITAALSVPAYELGAAYSIPYMPPAPRHIVDPGPTPRTYAGACVNLVRGIIKVEGLKAHRRADRAEVKASLEECWAAHQPRA